MHYTIIIYAMRHHGLGALLDRPKIGQYFRKALAGIILATDMGVHFEFMNSFTRLAKGNDFSLDCQRLLLCQAIIKCADVSNPVRTPYFIVLFWAQLDSESTARRVPLLGRRFDGRMDFSGFPRETLAPPVDRSSFCIAFGSNSGANLLR